MGCFALSERWNCNYSQKILRQSGIGHPPFPHPLSVFWNEIPYSLKFSLKFHVFHIAPPLNFLALDPFQFSGFSYPLIIFNIYPRLFWHRWWLINKGWGKVVGIWVGCWTSTLGHLVAWVAGKIKSVLYCMAIQITRVHFINCFEHFISTSI